MRQWQLEDTGLLLWMDRIQIKTLQCSSKLLCVVVRPWLALTWACAHSGKYISYPGTCLPDQQASLPPSYAGALVMPDLVCLSDTEEERGSLHFVLLFYLILNVSVHFEDFFLFFFMLSCRSSRRLRLSLSKNPVVLPCFLMVFRALLTLLPKIKFFCWNYIAWS